MAPVFFKESTAFTGRKRKTHIEIIPLKEKDFSAWLKTQSKVVKTQVERVAFEAKAGKSTLILNTEGDIDFAIAGLGDTIGHFDFAAVLSDLIPAFAKSNLNHISFSLSDNHDLNDEELIQAYTAWGWACYSFDDYKAEAQSFPALYWTKGIDKKRVLSAVESVNVLRDLVNTPANDLGPEELEGAVRTLAKAHNAKVSVIKGEQLIKTNFPLIYTVGQASPRAPRLIELNWGKTSHPKLTLVGKGVVFDTGGLDIKPSQYMRLMKKDMGGAAHVIALAKMIMDAGLKLRLKVIIPAVENAVGGAAFRPGDIIKSRKGLFIENTNTDAEGRLILADALSYACEDNPDLVIDFATLTGSARAGLGPDIPAFFCNNDTIHSEIRAVSKDIEDPVWPMPLHQPYRKHIENSVGELINSTGVPGDGIYSALFLESFIEKDVEWMHLDVFSWENTGRPGRPRGAADTGMRTIFEYVRKRYG